MMHTKKTYIEVILPLKFKGAVTYSVPDSCEETATIGMWVEVELRKKIYLGVIERVKTSSEDFDSSRIKDISNFSNLSPVSTKEIEFWHDIASYYMCTVGEVFKAAYPNALLKQISNPPTRKVKRATKPIETSEANTLSTQQQGALERITEHFSENKNVLLYGVTGSGKTEIYIHLIKECLARGEKVLYLVPEIAISRQLSERLKSVFGEQLLIFHSKQTAAQKREIYFKIKENEAEPSIVLGTRSSIFLPYTDLSLVIIDEEHDNSYKQTDPAPRYNGRDAAIMLANRHKAKVILGSATPSFETQYNVSIGKYAKVDLPIKFYNNTESSIKIIDTNKAFKLFNMKGSFAMELINEISATLSRGEQVMVFRSRRAYSPLVQCTSCGAIPKCPHCNVALSYHKFNNSLQCHYCSFTIPFRLTCKECGEVAITNKGAGTEKIEAELASYFPEAVVARFDADTTASKTEEEKILKEFEDGKIDILVGTQMITKGFDFKNLTLVAVISADSLFAVQDFRADERAFQLLSQLKGRAGRREKPGKIVIQTAQPDHPALKAFATGEKTERQVNLLAERQKFGYPPFVRLILITIKDKSEKRLYYTAQEVEGAIRNCGIVNYMGPVSPQMNRINGESIVQFWIKLPRTKALSQTKKALFEAIELIKSYSTINIDVDPM